MEGNKETIISHYYQTFAIYSVLQFAVNNTFYNITCKSPFTKTNKTKIYVDDSKRAPNQPSVNKLHQPEKKTFMLCLLPMFRALVSLSIKCILSDHTISEIIVSTLRSSYLILELRHHYQCTIEPSECLMKLLCNTLRTNFTKSAVSHKEKLYIYIDNNQYIKSLKSSKTKK